MITLKKITIKLKIMKKIILLISPFLFLGILSINAQYTMHFGWVGNANPYGSLTPIGSQLYGMTSITNSHGSIFRANASGGTSSNLFTFNGTNGSNPWGDLTVTGSGTKLFGMTKSGGLNGFGCVFTLNTNGTGYTILLNFNNTNNPKGAYPEGSLTLTTTETKLYGMTKSGGLYGFGCIFSINTDGTDYQVLYEFNGTNGGNPHGSLLLSGNKLYGMTEIGGTFGKGIIFSIDTSGVGFSNLFNFSGSNGENPHGSLIIQGNKLYGMTYYGGTSNNGVIFCIDNNGSNFQVLHNFNGTDGSNPLGSLISYGSKLYGVTLNGGINNNGIIFSISSDGTNYSIIHKFGSPGYIGDGKNPHGSLTLIGNTFFGLTSQGGYGGGGLFSFSSTTGIDILTEKTESINLYPNPFSTTTTLQSNTYLNNATFTLQNCLGQSVKQIKNISGQTITIQRDNLHSGLYVFHLTEDNKTFMTGKLVITDN